MSRPIRVFAPCERWHPGSVSTPRLASVKALQVSERGRLGLARVASAVAPAAAVRVGPLEYTTVDPPELPGPGWHRVHTRAGRDLRFRPLDDRGPRVDVLRRLGQLPVRARPRGRRPLDDGTRVVLEPVLGHAARGVPPAVRGRRSRRRRRLRPPRHRRPRPGHPDRVLLLDRRRLVQPSSWPTSPSSTASPTTCRTSGPCSSSRWPAASTPPCSPPDRRPLSAAERPVIAVLGAGTMGLAAVAGLVRYVPARPRRRRRPLPAPAARGPPPRRPRRRAGHRTGPSRPPHRRLPL